METQRSPKPQLGVRLLGPLPVVAPVVAPAAEPVVDCRCTRGELGVNSGLFLGQISLEVYIRVTSPESPHMGPAYVSKKTDKGRGVSIYVTTSRNPLVCTGRTAGKSPPTDTQGDHGVIIG